MTKQPLPHHVRTKRKLRGLAQSDVVALLGYPKLSNKLSRIEMYQSEPSISVGIGLSIIFDEPVEALFSGIYSTTRTRICENANGLVQELEQMETSCTPRMARRIAVLKELEQQI